MYVNPNFKTKKALVLAVKQRLKWESLRDNGFRTETHVISMKEPPEVTVFSPGPFPCPTEGTVAVEGPHYPEPHRWYARAEVVNGKVVRVTA